MLVKFFTTTYTPLDKDIVREQWVKGDLKDRLGIAHRRGGARNLEAAPLCKSPHLRSVSEAEPAEYHPVLTRSPGSAALSPPTASQPGFGSPMPEIDLEDAQYVLVDAPPAHLRPGGGDLRSSLIPSYYSASALPPPSPLPPVQYGPMSPPLSSSGGPSSPRHPLEGRETLSVPPSPVYGLTAQHQQPSQPPSPGYLSAGQSAYAPPPSAYEMRVRSPGAPSLSDRAPSEATFVTAREPSAEDGAVHYGGQRAPVTPTPTPPGTPGLVGGQRHERPESGVSWAGGRAV